jgi:hypothetical protein
MDTFLWGLTSLPDDHALVSENILYFVIYQWNTLHWNHENALMWFWPCIVVNMWTSNKIYNKNHLLHLFGILFLTHEIACLLRNIKPLWLLTLAHQLHGCRLHATKWSTRHELSLYIDTFCSTQPVMIASVKPEAEEQWETENIEEKCSVVLNL